MGPKDREKVGPDHTISRAMVKRNEDSVERELVRAVLARMKKDALTVESIVAAAEVVKSVGREKLVRQIVWFLMATITATLILLILHSLKVLSLPNDLVEKLGVLFGLQIVTLLTIIVRRLLGT